MNDLDLHPIAREAAKHLDGFEYAPDASGVRGNPVLRHADGRELWMREEHNKRGRVTVHASYNQLTEEIGYGQVGTPSYEITVAHSRGAEVLAKEITRRLLPEYTEEFARVRESVAKFKATNARRASQAKLLGELLSARPQQEGNGYVKLHFHGPTTENGRNTSGTVTLSGDGSTARWEFHTYDANLSALIADMIRRTNAK
jgi:hypothetical protein